MELPSEIQRADDFGRHGDADGALVLGNGGRCEISQRPDCGIVGKKWMYQLFHEVLPKVNAMQSVPYLSLPPRQTLHANRILSIPNK
jgi:hypothetical protein